MATTEDSTAQGQAALALRRAAERVVKTHSAYIKSDYDAAAEDLFNAALADLETALDVETDTAEVLGKLPVAESWDDVPDHERPEITVLDGNHCDAIYGLHGITQALVALDEPKSLELAIAARELAKRLYGGLGCVTMDVEKKIEQATGVKVWQ